MAVDQASDAQKLKRAADILLGTPYRTVARLGRGGMGEVVEAEHAALGKRVVVKVLHVELSHRPALADRLRLEGQVLARIEHPNVVEVSDIGETVDGRPYLVMEKLVGRTLREELAARGTLPVAEALDCVCQVLDGLTAVHAMGMVHRDVKLDNLFVCDAPRGVRRTVKLLDFGIAKVVDAARRANGPAPLAFPTEEGVAVGTPRFFSPEQARGQAVDARTDVYATGAVLYSLLAGRSPFEHVEGRLELSRAHVGETPAPPSQWAPQPIPRELDAEVLRALAKSPEARHPSAAAFAAALRAIAARPPPPVKSKWPTTEPLDPEVLRKSASRAPKPAVAAPSPSTEPARGLGGTARMPSLAPPPMASRPPPAPPAQSVPAPPERAIAPPGEKFQRYTIVRLLASGGMGEVYEAVHEFTGRRVALKILQLRHTNKADAIRRAKLEAVVLSRLDHPNIVKVHDADITASGTVWIAMELLRGKTLRDRMQASGPLPVAQALHYAQEIADGISAAHDIGAIHRDLKPENVFVTEQHQVKVLDLGTAKLYGSGQKTTDRGRSVGTPAYMSPEQILGEKPDAGTDIYALGLLLYEMLAGRHAYATHGELPNTLEWGTAHLLRPAIPLPTLAPHCPPYVWAVVEKAIHKKRDQRHATMAELAVSMRVMRERFVSESRAGGASQPPPPRPVLTGPRGTAVMESPVQMAATRVARSKRGNAEAVAPRRRFGALRGPILGALIGIPLAVVTTVLYVVLTRHSAPAVSPAASAPTAPPSAPSARAGSPAP